MVDTQHGMISTYKRYISENNSKKIHDQLKYKKNARNDGLQTRPVHYRELVGTERDKAFGFLELGDEKFPHLEVPKIVVSIES
jgi:hypothetical protein